MTQNQAFANSIWQSAWHLRMRWPARTRGGLLGERRFYEGDPRCHHGAQAAPKCGELYEPRSNVSGDQRLGSPPLMIFRPFFGCSRIVSRPTSREDLCLQSRALQHQKTPFDVFSERGLRSSSRRDWNAPSPDYATALRIKPSTAGILYALRHGLQFNGFGRESDTGLQWAGNKDRAGLRDLLTGGPRRTYQGNRRLLQGVG